MWCCYVPLDETEKTPGYHTSEASTTASLNMFSTMICVYLYPLLCLGLCPQNATAGVNQRLGEIHTCGSCGLLYPSSEIMNRQLLWEVIIGILEIER